TRIRTTCALIISSDVDTSSSYFSFSFFAEFLDFCCPNSIEPPRKLTKPPIPAAALQIQRRLENDSYLTIACSFNNSTPDALLFNVCNCKARVRKIRNACREDHWRRSTTARFSPKTQKPSNRSEERAVIDHPYSWDLRAPQGRSLWWERSSTARHAARRGRPQTPRKC